MNAAYKNSRINETLSVLAELSTYGPRTAAARRTNFETKAESISKWSMILAATTILCAASMALWHNFINPLPNKAKLFALCLIISSYLFSISAMLTPILASAITLAKWKKITLINLQDDTLHEQQMAYNLSQHNDSALVDAKYWLELKIKRVDASVTHVFGDKTATFSLLASGYLFSKEFGGFKLISDTIFSTLNWSNLTNVVLLGICALVFGMSIGAIMIRHIASRYRYQIELLDIARR